ncbi:hypothetical protein JHK85_000592 [Glycine max]|uniref:ATP-dependent DNA helicase n=1 Tax=Glycine max TaxID=3847 RepID=K7K221_SOYBN|nr:hypothetical protein JHK85_000592 [Glycine max]
MDGRIYNLLTVSEVTTLIGLQRINEIHGNYLGLGLQYPILFPYGEDGYMSDVQHRSMDESQQRKRNRVTLREFLCFRLQTRKNEAQTLLGSRRHFQQFVVDGYNMKEYERLHYIKSHQKNLCVDKYCCLNTSQEQNQFQPSIQGKHIVLPSSFVGDIYTIEFQKRGLPHTHILLFLHSSNKYPSPMDIEKIISTEISNKNSDPDLYECVKNHMVHGPCGIANRKSPYLKDGHCSKFFPKKRNDRNVNKKNGIQLDNRYVVPYNPHLQLKYRAHINVEWCNQSTSIKYLFEYINKGYNRITTAIPVGEYLHSQYMEEHLLFKKMLEFVYTIGRLYWVPPTSGELFYLRMMLFFAKGPCSYEEIKTIAGTVYPTSHDACFAMSFLHDDREYIDAIKEANSWGSGHYLRKLFVTMLISNSINRPEHVWEQTRHHLIDAILHEQSRVSNIPDDVDLKNLVVLHIKSLLQANRKSLRYYPPMPYTTRYEQRKTYDTIMNAISIQFGQMFFLYGYGGTNKKFMWRTLSVTLRLQGGKIAHSKFCIPIPTLQNSTCNIHQGSEVVEPLKFIKLIIWDETSFRSDIINATINSSYLWEFCQVLKLKVNMWIKQCNGQISLPNYGHADIQIPYEFLIQDYTDPIPAIVQTIYPNLANQYLNIDFLQSRSILASNIEKQILGEEIEYLSSDLVDMSDTVDSPAFEAITAEFLNTLKTTSIPNHSIKLKSGTPIMLIRNIDQAEGLCNGTRVTITRLANQVIKAKIIASKNIGSLIYVPRISMAVRAD